MREVFNSDEKLWKVNRLVRDPTDYADCREFIAKNYDKIHDIFLTVAARSRYPNIENFSVQTFANELGIMDSQMVNTSAIDRLYIAANVSIGQT
jgi:hypothetical protein